MMLGRKRKQLLDQLEKLRQEILPEIQAANAAGVQQGKIAEVSHYTRDMIREMCLPPDKAEAEREKRRQRTRRLP
ncbi:hypothetical protein O7626_38840 [Micromonospora sp. WMMD1102]|uniref:hypothetical protein n=1 Tax=Micromonospora sp. WMMD1102 TaxID=3016105 RepID=UPI00241546A4|nr:hypothetical protein [Micromonospora sp. WMMD1102]MDG4791777.1 hypothetical protein [Micromonospora sp. WMMD1102]